MNDETTPEETTADATAPGWEPPADDAPAPRLPDGRFLDPDTGYLVWYLIPYRGPGYAYTAGDVRGYRGDSEVPPAPVTPAPETPPGGDRPPVEVVPPSTPGTGEYVDETQPSRNVTPDGVAHFAQLVNDRTTCGGCGRDWPCGQVPDAALDVQVLGSTEDGRPAQRLVTVEQMAAMLGVHPDDLLRQAEQSRAQTIERTGVDPLAEITRAEDEGRRYGQ